MSQEVEESENAKFGLWFRKQRRLRKLARIQLAKDGITRDRIKEIEKGEGKGITRLECLFLAHGLGVDFKKMMRKACE